MWSYWIVDTRTGLKQLQVAPSAGSFGRVLNGRGQGGSHTFELAATELSREQWWGLTTPWARTLVVSWNGVAKYAGLITKRSYTFGARRLVVNHGNIRALLGRRYPFGVTGYWADPSETVPGKLECTGRALHSIAALVVQAGVVGPTDIYSLPIVLGGIVSGPHNRTYYNPTFETVESALEELQDADGGPDIDFEERWRPDGKLEWLMRTGNAASPAISGSTFEWNLAAAATDLTGLEIADDANNQVTGVHAIGAGSSDDMLVAGRGLSGVDVGPVPALDTHEAFKQIEDMAVLAGHARSQLATARFSTRQFSFSVQAGGIPDFAALRLGSIIRFYVRDDMWLPNGWVTLRLIGYSGEARSTRVTLDTQPWG